MFYSVFMATKTSIKVEGDVWKAFQAYARGQGRSASKQMEWLMKEAIANAVAQGKVIADISTHNAPDAKPSRRNSSPILKRSSG